MPELNQDREPGEEVLKPVTYMAGRTTMWNHSWRTLYDKLGGMILMYARQGGLNEHSAHDVLQEVMMTVLRAEKKEVAGYDPSKGSFQSWLKGIVHNRIRSLRRKDQKENPLPFASGSGADEGPALPEIPQPPNDFEAADDQQWQRSILMAALQKVRKRVSEDNFSIFMALLEEKASPAELAATYRKEVNNIYRIKNSCQTMLSEEALSIRDAWQQFA